MTEKISRNRFFKWILYLLTIPLIYYLDRMLKDQKSYGSSNTEYNLGEDIPYGLSINGPVIIQKTNNQINLYSSKCTHLGCQINKIENNQIVCPCHGSRYNNEGIPVKGPSIKPLKKLDYYLDPVSNNFIVKLV